MPNRRSNTDDALRVLDRATLLTHAGGDAPLAAALLALFCDHALSDADRLLGGPSDDERRMLAHRLKGAALAVGAAEIAEAAEAIEAGGDPGGLAVAVERFRKAVEGSP